MFEKEPRLPLEKRISERDIESLPALYTEIRPEDSCTVIENSADFIMIMVRGAGVTSIFKIDKYTLAVSFDENDITDAFEGSHQANFNEPEVRVLKTGLDITHDRAHIVKQVLSELENPTVIEK
jgi:hypothetical protein